MSRVGIRGNLHVAILVVIVGAAFGARSLAYVGNTTPVIVGDELTYKLMARNFAHGEGFRSPWALSAATNLPNPVYPALLSLSFSLSLDFYRAAKIGNAALGSLAGLLAFALARRWAPPGHALVAALLAVLVPSQGYANFALVEPLFFAVVLATFLTAAAVLERPSPSGLAGLGSLFVFAGMTKPTVLPIAVAVVVFVAVRTGFRGIVALGAGVALGWAAFAHLLPAGGPGGSLGFYEQHLASILGGAPPIRQVEIFLALVGLCLFLFPLVVPTLAGFSWRVPERTFRRLVGASLVLMALAVARFNAVSGESHVLHARYLAPMIFPLVVLAALPAEPDGTWRFRHALAWGALYVAGAATLWTLFLSRTGAVFFVTSPELYWLRSRPSTGVSPIAVLAVPLGLLLAAPWLSARARRALSIAWLVGVFSIANVVWARAASARSHGIGENLRPAARCIAGALPSGEPVRVAFVTRNSKWPMVAVERLAFLFDLDYRFLGSDATLAAAGGPSSLPADTEWLFLLGGRVDVAPSRGEWRTVRDGWGCRVFRREPIPPGGGNPAREG